MHLHIPKPCPENWDAMTPNEQGRFCNACSKTVVDFTRMTDDEVLNYFTARKEEKICGRIKRKPAVSEIIIEIPRSVTRKKLTYFQTFLLALLLSFGVIVSSGFTTKTHAGFVIENTQAIAAVDSPPPPPVFIEEDIYLGEPALIELNTMPKFPGGEDSLRSYFNKKLQAIDYSAYNDSLPRKLITQFTINTNGKPIDIQIIIGGLDSSFNSQIINIIDEMPAWEPGMMNGSPYPEKLSVPIKILRKE